MNKYINPNTYAIRYGDGLVEDVTQDASDIQDSFKDAKSWADRQDTTAEIVVLVGTSADDASWETLEDAGIIL